MTFEEIFKMRRAELGMTQLDIAYALKVTPATVSSWERGKMKPHYNRLAALSKILGISERDLLFPQDKAEENEDSKNVL